jgi:hypothetical protein
MTDPISRSDAKEAIEAELTELRERSLATNDDYERRIIRDKMRGMAAALIVIDNLPALDADGRKKLDPFVEIQLAQQAVKDWVEGFARLQDAKMDDPAKCDAEALAKAMHAAYEKHGCIEENINPLGALECAKVVIQDWSDRLAPTLSRKEYRDGVVNGMKNAMGLIDCLMATVFVVKGEGASAPPAAERRPAVERQYDEHGQAVCNHCNMKTNRAYAKFAKLQCWSCGNYFTDLTSGDAAQPGE